MKVFIASMIAAYAAAADAKFADAAEAAMDCCPAYDKECWMDRFRCDTAPKTEQDKCYQQMDFEINNPEKNGGFECR